MDWIPGTGPIKCARVAQDETERWAEFLLSLAEAAPERATLVQNALLCNAPTRALKALWGRRKPKTLRHLGLVLKKLRDYKGSNAALFELSEVDLVNYLFDRADEPCGKTTPESIVATVRLAWKKWGMPPVVSEASTSTAASLREVLSRANLRAVRKALNLPLVAVVAAEMAVANPDTAGLTPVEISVLGMEVLKVYLCARGHDTQHLCYKKLRWAAEVWGTEEGFVETKTTGAGRRVEVLPAWISRHHAITGVDWAAKWTTYLERVGILPPPEEGYLLQDTETGERMSYDVKLRLTREAWSRLELSTAAAWLGMTGAPRYMPVAFCNLLGEHSARGVLNTWGVEAGVSKERLQFLGRWTPKESVEDYARSSRAVVIGIAKEIGEKIRSGWRPDEAITGLRAQDRCRSAELMVEGFLFGDCQWSEERGQAIKLTETPVWEDGVAQNPAVQGEEDAQDEDAALLILVHDPRTLRPDKLHLAKPRQVDGVLETACGKTLARDIRVWTEHDWVPGKKAVMEYTSTCEGYKCRGFFAENWGKQLTLSDDDDNEEEEPSDSDDQVEPAGLPVL